MTGETNTIHMRGWNDAVVRPQIGEMARNRVPLPPMMAEAREQK